MDAPDQRRSPTMDRRPSTHISQRFSTEESDADDDYDLQAIGIADGFHPPNGSQAHSRISSQHTNEHQPAIRRSTPPPRPSSTTKPRNLDSFALRHDGAMAPSTAGSLPQAGSSSGTGTVTRSSSISTDIPVMRPESPYHGPSAPSHPYQMYPQNARLARTSSVGTTSTDQASSERQYSGPHGPTHPYGMYPQNTVLESEDSDEETAAIPVGFPGHRTQYRRRFGPDGEEAADIIGPDGHTEQLPPYTQYPDEAFARKAESTVSILPGAGGIGLATRNPEFASAEDVSTPTARLSSRNLTLNTSDPVANLRTADLSEKPAEKKWKTIARRKVWGIVPIWVFVLVGIVLLLFAIILATAFVVIKHKVDHHHPSNDPPPTATTSSGSSGIVTVTATFDATPIATAPTALASLPMGTYGLNISSPSTTFSDCLQDQTQSDAWSCSIPADMLRIIISQSPGVENLRSNMITIVEGNDSSTKLEYYYGAQPPTLSSSQPMTLVYDTDSSLYGPAWFYQTVYDKIVIVSEDELSVSLSSKHSLAPADLGGVKKRNLAQVGDKPWFCYWNGTLLETFIYPNASTGATSGQSNSAGTASSATAAAVASSTGVASPTSMGSTPSQSASGANYLNQFYSFYPKVFRMEEYRTPATTETIPPYCVQMQILNNHQAVPWVSITGQQQRIVLNETDPTSLSSSNSRRDHINTLRRRTDDDEDNCRCMWIAP
ncbi:MAG: hypothetical protein M1818_005286 [Claussenomyces sp. TS43310]|nr:MAG: hypothetical protein M1818_005286 [Claussenomyces sp. TS43310]